MRAAGSIASVAFGALAVGFGAGWIARGLQRMPPSDDVAVDTPPRKPATSASSAAIKTAVATAPTPKLALTAEVWTYPSSLPPGLCDPPAPFSWPSTTPAKESVLRVDGTHYLVGSGFVDHLLEDQAELMKSVRIVPEQEGGVTIGVKMFGIKSTSVLASMGFQNGDTLVCLNTYPMSSPEKALEAYSKLHGMKDVAAGLVRDGKGVVLQYHVAGSKGADLENPF
jgi:hypothetical protein